MRELRKIEITHRATNNLSHSLAAGAADCPGFAAPARAFITHKETNDFVILFSSGKFSSFSLGKIPELTDFEASLCNLFIYNRLRSIFENYPPSHDWFPPYVEYSQVRRFYSIVNISCLDSGNLYAFVIERTFSLMHTCSRNGMIIQMSAFCTPRMSSFQEQWFNHSSFASLAFFDDRPGKLFDNLEHIRVVIPMMEMGDKNSECNTTCYNKFYTEFRPHLFNTLIYYKSNTSRKESSVLKISNSIANSIANKIWSKKHRISEYESLRNNENYVYYGYGYGYFGKILNYKSYFNGEKIKVSTGDKYYYINTDFDKNIFVGIMNTSLFYWYYVNYSDGHNFTKFVIGNLPFDYEEDSSILSTTRELMVDLKAKCGLKVANYKSTGRVEYEEYYPKKSKSIIDKIDIQFAKHYGFSEEEIDFILNYDIKYRMGDSLYDTEE